MPQWVYQSLPVETAPKTTALVPVGKVHLPAWKVNKSYLYWRMAPVFCPSILASLGWFGGPQNSVEPGTFLQLRTLTYYLYCGQLHLQNLPPLGTFMQRPRNYVTTNWALVGARTDIIVPRDTNLPQPLGPRSILFFSEGNAYFTVTTLNADTVNPEVSTEGGNGFF